MDRFASALASLDGAEDILARLEAGCCIPDQRSPRMHALAVTLGGVRASLAALPTDARNAADATLLLEDAGAQVGSLQIACCAPKRIPLYADLLLRLTEARLAIDGAFGGMH